MKTTALLAAAVVASTGAALAADLPATKAPVVAAPAIVSPWDFDIGAGVTTNYIFRGITQSNQQPSVAAHGELRYNVDSTWQLYAGISGESIKFSPNYYPAGSPAMELDGDAGIRGTFDKFSFDLGGIIYGYPDTPTGTHLAYFGGALQQIGLSPRTDTWGEVYIKPSYTVNDWLTIGANFFYTPSYINTGANGEYLSGTGKVTAPGEFAWLSASGEIGYQWLGRVNNVYTGNNSTQYTYIAGGYGGYSVGQLPSYLYGNVGLSATYKFVTLDLRFYGTNLSKSAAYQLTGIPDTCSPVCSTTSKYGQNAFVATLSFDLTSKDLK